MKRPAIGYGATIGFVAVPCLWAAPVVLGFFIGFDVLLFWIISAVLALVCIVPGEDSYISWLPVTHEMRADNRKALAKEDAWTLRCDSERCRDLAAAYRQRGQIYDAEILEVEADHKERQAAIRDEDAERITRELQDREMLKLTKSGE